MMDIFKEFTFEAAHHLPRFPKHHKCRRLHGHSYHVRIFVSGRVDEETGIVRDFADISSAWKENCFSVLDHNYLNKIEGLENPTVENLAFWIWDRLNPILDNKLSVVEVMETCTSGVSYHGWDRGTENLRKTSKRQLQ